MEQHLIVVDTHQNNLDRPKRKWYSHRRSRKQGICFHHTGVTGGFGPSKRLLAKYRKQECDLSVWGDQERFARAMALADRYAGQGHGGGVSYHVVYNPHVNVLFLNLPFDLVSWHGNGANTNFIGFAWDESSASVGGALDVTSAQDAVARTCALLPPLESGALEFTCHSAWTNKPHDPGPHFISLVIDPMASQLWAHIDWDFKDPKKRRAKSMGQVINGA